MFALLAQKRFAPLFWTQFLSAFNDNFLKNTLVFLIMYKLSGPNAESLITLAGAIFILPFFILSGLGGQLADRYDKAMIAQRLKLTEMLAVAIAVAGFFYASVPVLLVALALFGILSTLFGPIKYGILPDHLQKSELPTGNALIEGATFIAILLGTIVGGLASRGGGDPSQISGFLLAVALACYIASRFIPATGGKAPDLRIDANIFRSTGALLFDLWSDRRLWIAGVMVSLFWMFGAIALSLLPPMIKLRMGGEEMVVSVYLSVFAISVALGSGLGAFFCAGRIVLLPAPVATLVLGAFAADLAFALHSMPVEAAPLALDVFFRQPPAWRVGFDLAGMAVAGGVLAVPSFAAAQAWAPVEKRARIVAAINVLNSAFMTVGGLATAALQKAGLSIDGVFALMAGVALIGAVWMFFRLPTSPMRDFVSILFRAFYRLEVKGRDNIAKAGPNAVIALNHVSFLDAALALSLLDHDPIFAIDTGIARRWWVKPFLRLVRVYPLDPTKPMATRGLIHAVRNGETLVIFPEGRLTVTGSLMKVYDGAGMIAEKSGRTIVPARIDGLEASAFSRLSRAQAPRRFLNKVTVTILEPVELKIDEALVGKARRQAAGAALYQIMSDLLFRTTDVEKTVFTAVADAARKHGMSRIALQDPASPALSYRRLLIGARLLAKKFARLAPAGEPVGLMLPNANGAGAAFLGLISANRPPAMINFTAGPANIVAACTAANVETIVTSRAFIEKARLQAIVDRAGETIAFVYLEDLRDTISGFDKLRAFLKCGAPLARAKPDDLGVILFTSGSEGAPKGVALSHRNILANVAQVAARIDFGPTDRLFNVLPIFHSFGLTGGLVLPLVSGVPIFLYPSPLHYRVIPELIYGSNATILFGTDTLLNGYARSAHPYDLRSLRYVIAGAEAVRESTRRLYGEKFGLRLLEGYGVTETSPVLALNTPMFNRFGTVGLICPGMEPRLERIEGIHDGARLSVRGPNVMLGYLRAENPGVVEPPPGGWHDTGDIVSIDRDGFITIKGRAKRFAKVGGEMISLAAVENLAALCWPAARVAAVAQPDPRKGEKIVLCTEHAGVSRADFIASAKARGASELMFPAKIVVMDSLPLLGSGKIDYPALSRAVAERGDNGADSGEAADAPHHDQL
ncbi:acyl-[ACP]--phospholipid O-acyltransferase [Rhodoblastus sp.]|uniref:acyl-[ACP]--phospholipid O-acyltransferase n=1 Tax=Rhodoblastus sp. TaxID=1962975 RepID=UPI00260DAAB6|nr:acyl-[ACP]--phospholipid O-acyltransferase [Rhodoblastus sp.]